MKIAHATALLALVGASGCARNSVLELQVRLPPAPDDGQEWFAQVQVRRAAGNGFDSVWMGRDAPTLQLVVDNPLVVDPPQWDCVSVDSTDDSIDVNVRVRFCHHSSCLGFGDDTAPERRYWLEHPFYIGRHTYWKTTIEAVPECGSDTDCAIGRCVEGQCGCVTNDDCSAGSGYRCDAGGCVQEVDRCEIEGCVTGGTTHFCRGDGAHFCETGGYDRVEEAYACSAPD